LANPTTNYGFVLPTSSDLVTDLPADFDVALQGVDTRLKALQPGTTLGDLVYSSATANTNTRLGIGSSGNILTVAGGVPTWAAPASAGGMTVIASGSLSGTSLSLTSIPGTYNNLQLVLRDFTFSGGCQIKPTFNSVTAYATMQTYGQGASSSGTSFYQSLGWIQIVEAAMIAAQEDPIIVLNVYDYANTTSYKGFDGFSAVTETATNTVVTSTAGGSKNTAAVTSITMALTSSATYTAGTYTLYGVK
jgi:hypothetical protein